MLFSADAGKWKPSAEPYLDLLNATQTVAPENGVFIGDDPSNDMVGGQRAGLANNLNTLKPAISASQMTSSPMLLLAI